LNKLDSILKKNKEIKDFRIFDMDQEWLDFRTFIDHQNVTYDYTADHISDYSQETSRTIIFLLSFAASFILIFALVFTLRKPEKTSDILITKSQPDSVRLTDGSLVVLHPNSALDYYVSLNHANERILRLRGDARFSITKSLLPLKVYNDKIIVEVLGTEFSIVNTVDTVTITNISGSVKVSEYKNNTNFRILKAGDKFTYSNGIFTNVAYSLKTMIPTPETDEKIIKNQSAPDGNSSKKSIYLLNSVIKNHLIKYNKKKIKLDKKAKLDVAAKVKLDLTMSYQDLLEDLKKQGFIDFKPGNCSDCYIITSPNKN